MMKVLWRMNIKTLVAIVGCIVATVFFIRWVRQPHLVYKPYQNILIFTTHGGGSSYVLEEFFNHHAGFIYYAEPLVSYETDDNRLNQQKAFKDLQESAADHLQSIFSCKFQNLKAYLKSMLSEDVKPEHEYSKETSELINLCKNSKDLQKCAEIFDMSCQRRPYKVVKTSSILYIESLASIRKNLTIVHLVKDPRAVITSWIQQGTIKTANQVEKASISLCKSMYHNLIPSPAHFFANYIRMRYEDVTERPFHFSLFLYRGLGLPHHQAITTRIEELQAAGMKLHMHNWRRVISWEYVNIVQKNCQEIMKLLNYIPLHDERALHDENVRLMKQEL